MTIQYAQAFSQALAGLARPKVHAIEIRDLDGFYFARSYYGPAGINELNRWSWIVQTVAERSECNQEQLDSFENDDGWFITKDGQVIAQVVDVDN